MQHANFVKINLRIAVWVLVLDIRTGTFLFPKTTASNNVLCYAHSLTRRRQTAETAALKFPVYLTNRITLPRRETGSEEGGGLRPFSAL